MRKRLFPYIVAVVIAFLVEIVVFNFRCFQSFFYRERNLADYYVQTDYGTMLDNGDICIEGDAFVVSIVLEGEDVHNIYVDAEYVDEAGNGTGVCDVQLYVQDELLSEGEQMVRPQIQRKIFRQIPASEYMFYTPFGKTQMLQLDFYPEAGRVIRLHDMRVNVKRPLFISGGRLLLLFLLGVVLVMFRPASELWTIKAAEPGKKGNLVCLAFFAVFILGFAYWILQNPLYFKQTFQPYAELARAFLRGECSVGDATEEVAALEDKLVSWGRGTEGIKFDYVLYHGKYYVYFGVLPCLLFYLPWRMITGQDLSDAPVQLLLAGMLVMGLFFLLKEFIRRYYKDASLAILLLFTGMMAYGTYLPSMLSDPNVYQVAILSGVCLTVWGIYCWMRAAQSERKRKWLLAGSLLMALTAAARPTLLLYSVLAVFIFWEWFLSIRQRKGEAKAIVIDMLCFAVPYCLVAIGVMYYNYIRFENPFQFGMLYNMTCIPSKHTAVFYPELIWICIYEYFLRPPVFQEIFPFLEPHFEAGNIQFSGMLMYYQIYGIGLLAGNPVLLGALIPAYDENAKRKKVRKALLVSTGLGIFLMLFSASLTQFVLGRYALEFSYPIIFIAAMTILAYEESTKRTHLFRGVMAVGIIVPLIIQALQIFNTPDSLLLKGNEELFYRCFYSFHM